MSSLLRKGSKHFLNQFRSRGLALRHPNPRQRPLYAAARVVFNDAMQDQPVFNVRQFVAAARITVPDARLPALAAGFASTLETMARLLALDYGDAEPASRFRPPASP